jgi:hypothetical protein
MFEVEIVNDELYFDYKLRNGICKIKAPPFNEKDGRNLILTTSKIKTKNRISFINI